MPSTLDSMILHLEWSAFAGYSLDGQYLLLELVLGSFVLHSGAFLFSCTSWLFLGVKEKAQLL